MKKVLLILFLCSLFACSSDSNLIFQESYLFKDTTWKRDNNIDFKINIDDTKSDYSISFVIKHNYYYPFSNLIFGITIVTPDHVERTLDFNFDIKDENSNYIGTQKGEIWEIKFEAVKKIAFAQKGEYIININNYMPIDIFGIVELETSINKTSSQKQENTHAF